MRGAMTVHIRNVSKTYSNGVQALKDVTLTIPPRDEPLLNATTSESKSRTTCSPILSHEYSAQLGSSGD
jgi:ABC-type ATPase involved in cell division